MRTKAAYLVEANSPLVIGDEVEIPVLKAGQVLVRLAYSGVCHSQLMEVQGKRGTDRYLPHLLGHEGAGVVVEVGPGVKKVSVGDRTVVGWIKGDGSEALGTQYTLGAKVLNAGAVTTFQQYAVISENRCTKLDSDIPLKLAVLFGCALPTGAGIVFNTMDPQPGTSLGIWGLGGIGVSALLAARLFKLKELIVVDIEAEKLKLAKELGATHAINPKETNALEKILELTAGRGLDYCVEAAGRVETIELAFQSVRRNGGHCVFASHPPHGEKISIDPFELIAGKRLEGSWGGACAPDVDVPRFARLYREGKLPLEKLLSRSYSLENINQAFTDLKERKVVRALIEIDPSLDT